MFLHKNKKRNQTVRELNVGGGANDGNDVAVAVEGRCYGYIFQNNAHHFYNNTFSIKYDALKKQ